MLEIRFLIQSDPGMRVEKNAIRRFVDAAPGYAISTANLADVSIGGANIPRRGTVPVGTVEFCKALMKLHELACPPAISYPFSLSSFLGREIEKTTWGKTKEGDFVKPADDIKTWTGHIRGNPHPDDVAVLEKLPSNYSVWRSDPVTFLSETRFYISKMNIAGHSRYDDGPDDAPEADIEIVRQALKQMPKQPAGMSLDFGVTDKGETILVEANDGWALGYYPWGNLTPSGYANLIVERWMEICKIKL